MKLRYLLVLLVMFAPSSFAHKIGPHLLDFNLKSEYEGYVSRVKPKVIKLVDANPERVNRYYNLSPKSIFVIRSHPLSEQKSDMQKDPVGTGNRHCSEWASRAKSYSIPKNQMIFLGINEPAIWSGDAYENATISYTVAFLDCLKGHGLRGGALNLNTGHPRENGRPSYESLKPIRDAIVRGDHVLMVHEYWDKRGPDAQWPWNTGRFTRLAKDWNVKVIVGETGIDEVVNGAKNHSGWRDHVSASEYRKQLMRYSDLISQDKRIIGAVVFTAGGNNDWRTFETWEALKDMDVNTEFGEPDLGNSGPTPVPKPDPKPTSPAMTSIPGAPWTKVTAATTSGKYWKLAKAEFLGEAASQGRHHIFSGNGVTLVAVNANGAVTKSGGDIPLWSQDEYCVTAEGQGVTASDKVCGLRMEPKNHHVSYRLFFEVANGGSVPTPDPGPAPTPTPNVLAQVLINEGQAKQVIQFNPNAALQKAIFTAGFVPNSGEFKINVAGQVYVGQRAEHLVTGEVRIFYCRDGDWGNVSFVKK
jgi:hypothetical protein